jgi:tetratricopeptide (TPR) repeat protein
MRLPISWNQLGVGYMINDDWKQGEQCFQKSIAAMKELDDYQEYKISLPLANLACALWLTGRFEEAVQALEEGLAYRAAEFGPDDRESFM